MFTFRILVAILIFEVSTQHSINPRIVNGRDARRDQFPFIAYVEMGYPPLIPFSYACTGVVYDEYHILTTSVCVKRVMTVTYARVKIGMHFTNHVENHVQIIDVIDTISHENYIGHTNFWKNDVGLLILQKAINQPVTAKISEQDSPRGMVYIAGWGRTSADGTNPIPTVLQLATLLILENAVCQTLVSKLHNSPTIWDSQLCIHSPQSVVTGYTGDSGGPIVQYVNGEPEVVGLLSWTAYPEMSVGAPTVNTRLASFDTWIKGKVQKIPNINIDGNLSTPLLVTH